MLFCVREICQFDLLQCWALLMQHLGGRLWPAVAQVAQMWPSPQGLSVTSWWHRWQSTVYTSSQPGLRSDLADGRRDPGWQTHWCIHFCLVYLGTMAVPSPLAYMSFQVPEVFSPYTVASVSVITYHSASGVFFTLHSKCILDQVDYSFKR